MHDETMQLLLSVTAAWLIIVAVAQICGRLAPRIGQPPVVGEMVAGVLLGPSVLGALLPDVSGWVFSVDVKPVLYVIAMTGLCFYMFLVGVEHDHQPTSRRDAATPVVLGIAGVIVPVGLGALATLSFVEEFRPDGVSSSVFVLFVAGSLSVTAFSMLARILQQRRMNHTRFGATATRAAAIDDALAWCFLAVISALAVHGSAVAALSTIIPAVVFAVPAFWLLPKIFRKPMENAVRKGHIGDGLFVSILCLVLAAGWFTDYIGIYSVFGGFIAGLALPKVPGFPALLNERALQLVRCLFLPVFFAYSGLNTDLGTSFEPVVLLALGIMLVTAFLSKALASMAVLKAFRWPWGESVAMSGLMNARGLMILIYINIGLGLGIIDTRLFSVLVLVAIITTALAVPIYRTHFSDSREADARITERSKEPHAVSQS